MPLRSDGRLGRHSCRRCATHGLQCCPVRSICARVPCCNSAREGYNGERTGVRLACVWVPTPRGTCACLPLQVARDRRPHIVRDWRAAELSLFADLTALRPRPPLARSDAAAKRATCRQCTPTDGTASARPRTSSLEVRCAGAWSGGRRRSACFLSPAALIFPDLPPPPWPLPTFRRQAGAHPGPRPCRLSHRVWQARLHRRLLPPPGRQSRRRYAAPRMAPEGEAPSFAATALQPG